MKKTLIFATLILGMSAMAMAQSCSTGNGYNSSTNYYNSYNDNYNNGFQRLGVIKSKWRGSFRTNSVVDARILEKTRKRITVEYIFANGDVLEVQGRAGQPDHVGGQGGGHAGGHGQGAGYGNGHGGGQPYVSGVNNSNNYYYSSSNQSRGKEYTLHCATMNGIPINVKCGTLKMRRSYGQGMNSILDLEVGRRGFFKGNVKIF